MINGDEFVLRRLEPKDIEQLYLYRNDSAIVASLGGFSAGYSVRDLEDWLQRHRSSATELLLCIAEPDTDICLGHVGLYNIDHRVRKAELAILVGDKQKHGRGLGKRVCQAVIDYARRQLNLRRIELSLLGSNDIASRLYASLGFVQEGVQTEAEFRDGQYVDVVLMAKMLDEPG